MLLRKRISPSYTLQRNNNVSESCFLIKEKAALAERKRKLHRDFFFFFFFFQKNLFLEEISNLCDTRLPVSHRTKVIIEGNSGTSYTVTKYLHAATHSEYNLIKRELPRFRLTPLAETSFDLDINMAKRSPGIIILF